MSGYNGQQEDDSDRDAGDDYNLYYTKRGKVQINLSQQFGHFGSLYVTGSQQSYWHTDETNKLLQIGYSDTLAGIRGACHIAAAARPARRNATKRWRSIFRYRSASGFLTATILPSVVITFMRRFPPVAMDTAA